MSKFEHNPVSNPENQTTFVTQINTNLENLETFSDSVLSRDGTAPNAMEADLDMNSNHILNSAAPTSATHLVRLQDIEDLLPTIYVQASEPDTSATISPTGSLWVDTDDYQLYRISGEVWVDTGLNIKGDTGDTGPQGIQGDNQDIFVQNDAPVTTGLDGNLWIDANSSDLDLYILVSSVWTDTGVNLKGATGATGAAGDAATIAVGTVTTVAAGEDATVTNVGTSSAAIFDFEIPQGEDGAGAGNVNTVGAPVVDENLVMYDGTDGNSIQDSGIAFGDVVTPSSTDTFTNKTFDANGTGNSISNIETADIASGSKTGADADLVTGTAGTSGNLSQWNVDGDLVDGPSATNPQFTTIELGHASDTTIQRSGAGAITVEGVGVALNSTSAVHTASTIELGAASDTTLSRSAAGILAVEGSAVTQLGTSNQFAAVTEKTTLHDDDLFIIEDSEASGAKKRVKKSNVGGGGGNTVVYAIKTASQGTTSSSFVDVTDLSFSIGASETWFIDIHFGYSQTAVGGSTFGVSVNGPASPSDIDISVLATESSGPVYSDSITAYDDAVTISTASTALTGMCRMVGRIVNGTNAGTVIMRFRANGGVMTATVHACATLRAEQTAQCDELSFNYCIKDHNGLERYSW